MAPLPVTPISECSVGDTLGDVSLTTLSFLYLNPGHEALEMIEVECHGMPALERGGPRRPCPKKARFQCTRFFATVTACDDCRAKYEYENKISAAKTYWESICPADYRDTSLKHEDFPKHILASLSGYKGEDSLFFYGPSRSGKTRLATVLLKRCLVAGLHVGCMWPEEMKHAARSQSDRLKLLNWYARYDLLLMDDALLTGAQDERISDFLKDLVELLMRHKRRFIITSQVGGEDYQEQADKWKNQTKADRERIEALWARLRERCRVIPFVPHPEALPF